MVYTFADNIATIVGPGGAFNLSNAVAEEGISVNTNDRSVVTRGADGVAVTTRIMDKTGTLTLTLQKISPVNALLSAMFAFQDTGSATWAKNVINITNIASGDTVTCRGVAFKKEPELKFGQDPGNNVWEFTCERVDRNLGSY